MSAIEFYDSSGSPATSSQGASATMRAEFDLIQTGFGKLPDLAANGDKAVVINAGGTAMTVTAAALALAVAFTTAGSGGITVRSTSATDVTLPTTGTLATLAGVEELDNKTLDASVGKGVWTASGTWTLPAVTLGGAITYGGVALTNAVTGTGKMVLDTSPTIATPVINSAAHVGGTWVADATWTLPAFTLGGTVSGGGQQLNNIIIVTSTPLAGTFTTLTYTNLGAVEPTTGWYSPSADTIRTPNSVIVDDNLTVSGVGPHAIGGSTSTIAGLMIRPNSTANAGSGSIAEVAGTVTVAANNDTLAALSFSYAINTTIASGTFTGLTASMIDITGAGLVKTGTGTIDNASALRINGAPSIGTNNYALWVDAGSVRVDGTDGAGVGAGTLTTAPSAGDPDKWIPINSDGTQYWVPAWSA